jgi:hypothetical protein
MTDWTRHPIYCALTAPTDPFSRHALLHHMQAHLAERGCGAGLSARVQHFVERGVPYFAPADSHYRDWAAKAAALWDEVHEREAAVATA